MLFELYAPRQHKQCSKTDIGMITRLNPAAATHVRFEFEGKQVTAASGETVAAALLFAGVRTTRTTPETGAPRAPFCMMGSCFECLVEIDGIPNRQGCMVEVRAGMVVRAQVGAAQLELNSGKGDVQ